MKLALKIASEVVPPDCPIGCVLVCNKTKIACGVNQTEIKADPTAHAELLCIQEACLVLGRRNLSDCVLYCTLEPCPMCEEAIKLARIEKVVFGAFRKKQSNDNIKFIGGILENECANLLSNFFFSIRD